MPSALRWATIASLRSSLALALAAGYGLCCSSSVAHLASFLCHAASRWCQARSPLSCLLSILCASWGLCPLVWWWLREWLALPLVPLRCWHCLCHFPGSAWGFPGSSLVSTSVFLAAHSTPFDLPCLPSGSSLAVACLPLVCPSGPAVLPSPLPRPASVAPLALMDAYLSIVCDITAALVPRGFQGGGPGWVAAPWVVDLRYLGTIILASQTKPRTRGSLYAWEGSRERPGAGIDTWVVGL
ncbi:hypothetical protein FBPa18_0001 [Pseudomonas phage vB_PaeP_FBPa18]|nr:hypothetical protein FBPa18_0001 [Pseudomonas phage vB_PaeP_FBPa18]